MTIYFDNNKNAYGFEIDNPIATVQDELWHEYSGDKVGTTWNIVNGEFVGDIVAKRKKEFYNNFIELSIGNYRKKPKGYSSAVESFVAMSNLVDKATYLPADTITIYPSPNFSNGNQCSEEWLEANKIKIGQLSKEDFDKLYIEFITKWNTLEHEV